MGPEVFENLTPLLAFLVLFIAVVISASSVLKTMITLYRVQAFVLALLVLTEGLRQKPLNFALPLVATLPLVMALAIKPILARATLVEHRRSLPRAVRAGTVELTWLQHGHLRLRPGLSFLVDTSLTAGAFVVAYRFNNGSIIDLTSLAVSMALLLLGLFTTINSEDIIAQIIGLLVAEHGLFLAAVKVIAQPSLAAVFAISLFFYIVLTLTILLWILPTLRRRSGSLRVDEQRELRG